MVSIVSTVSEAAAATDAGPGSIAEPFLPFAPPFCESLSYRTTGVLLGIGVDLCRIDRIARLLQVYGPRFSERCFRSQEYAAATRRGSVHLAKRLAQYFAAKEATFKALGTGMRQGLTWHDIEIDHLPSGQPLLRLHGQAVQHARRLVPAGMAYRLALSLTGEPPLAQAFVVLWAFSAPPSSP